MIKAAQRFIQRTESYSKAFSRLQELVQAIEDDKATRLFKAEESGLQLDIIRESLIKRFEFTQELSWNVLKDLLAYEGETNLAGSRDTYRRALKYGFIDNPLWMDMIADRNLSAHDYNDKKAADIAQRIIRDYYPLLKSLYLDMKEKANEIAGEEGYESGK